MLQQTQVARVVNKWQEFVSRWPDPPSFAAATLPEVLRAWQGLGYPRRAAALHQAAAAIAVGGWPADAAGLRELPGVGEYTARALQVLAFERPSALPMDVNIARVTSRAALGREPRDVPRKVIADAVDAGRPAKLSARDYTLALFDAGALHCRAVPRCEGCPLAAGCRWRKRKHARSEPAAPHRRQPAYRGSIRELRGVILRAVLDDVEPSDLATLQARAAGCTAATRPGAVADAVRSLQRDGLISGKLTDSSNSPRT